MIQSKDKLVVQKPSVETIVEDFLKKRERKIRTVMSHLKTNVSMPSSLPNSKSIWEQPQLLLVQLSLLRFKTLFNATRISLL